MYNMISIFFAEVYGSRSVRSEFKSVNDWSKTIHVYNQTFRLQNIKMVIKRQMKVLWWRDLQTLNDSLACTFKKK